MCIHIYVYIREYTAAFKLQSFNKQQTTRKEKGKERKRHRDTYIQKSPTIATHIKCNKLPL